MDAISDMLLGKGENSREIMINSWSERYWIILLVLGVLLVYIYYTKIMYNQSDSLIDIFKDMWTVPIARNYVIYLILLGLIGYFYPLNRKIWMILLLITMLLSLYVTFSIVY